jgi:predicted RNA methylase
MREQPMLFESEPVYRPELAQWHTPPRLAAKMATEHARLIRGARVLEPSAGGGALVRAALDVGASRVEAFEIDPAWCARLRDRFEREIDEGRVSIIEGDFLAFASCIRGYEEQTRDGHACLPYDTSLSNPPFDNGLDTRFLEALRPLAPEHVTLTNASALFGRERFEKVWSKAHVRQESKLVQRPKFGGDGSGGGMNDVSVTWWGAHAGPVMPTTWWPEAWS